MFFKQILMDDSGALSYIIGCPREKTACVVNPKKDIREYLDSVAAHGMEITTIFETAGYAKNKSGQKELSALTGAPVYFLEKKEKHGGKLAQAGSTFDFGDAEIRIVNSPQYNAFSSSVLVIDRKNQDKPWLVLTRRCLYTDNLSSELSGKELANRVMDYVDFYEAESSDGLTDNLASLSRNIFNTSRTEIAKMSLPA